MKVLAHHQYFVTHLLAWNKLENTREMPWKGETDPYKIWLSEIILQQTRVEQGLGYFQRFITQFPTVKHLAEAPEMSVFKLWEGLGYYTRCKNLIETARFIHEQLNGEFPHTYAGILALKGVGPYTAAAIASFAYNLPHAVVDGNVFRVLSRYFAIATPIDSTPGRHLFAELASKLVDTNYPGVYNQAIMDFGATVCKPQVPLCETCVLKEQCKAFQKDKVMDLPVKEKSIVRRTRWFYYFVVESGEFVQTRKRGQGDIWENLYEFVLHETAGPLDDDGLQEQVKAVLGNEEFKVLAVSAGYKQILTHQTIKGQFVRIQTPAPIDIDGYVSVPGNTLQALPFPKFISNYLKDKNVSLNLFNTE